MPIEQKNKTTLDVSIFEILSIEELLFAFLILTILILIILRKYKSSKLLNINIKKFITLVIGLEFAVIFFILFELIVLDRTENKLANIFFNKFQMINLADRLRQSSDDLTHYARSYTITNNKKYKQRYFNILDIRNGIKKRPLYYESIYWDLNKQLREKIHPLDKKVSLKYLMSNLPYTKKELNLLKLSEKKSNDLVNLELKAFEEMKSDNQQEAIKLLHSEEYYKAKEKIMFPIDSMILNLYKRSNQEISFLQEKIKFEFWYLLVSIAFFILLNIIIYLMLMEKLGKPISYLTNAIYKFKSGKKNIKKVNFYSDEIGDMNNQFFYMKDVIDKQQEKLNNLNKNLEIKVNDKTKEIANFNKDLQKRIYERTEELEESNEELQTMIYNLEKTQDKLIESEKMASLGGLVAGVAHEINTPVGIGLTGITHFLDLHKNIKLKYKNDDMTEDCFESYLNKSQEIAILINSNLNRTVDLVKSFKQVAIDQTSEEKRSFNLKEYIDEVLLSLGNITKKTNLNIKVNCHKELVIYSYPGAFAHIITNLIINSITHAFEEKEKGNILINIIEESKKIKLIYTDNGKGIKEENLEKIFEPFFTTNREKGGTGLGLNIIYNIVTNNLKGTITCESKIKEGVKFIITLDKLN